jgi:hypothetical protein
MECMASTLNDCIRVELVQLVPRMITNQSGRQRKAYNLGRCVFINLNDSQQ